jgi:hypothetical protein
MFAKAIIINVKHCCNLFCALINHAMDRAYRIEGSPAMVGYMKLRIRLARPILWLSLFVLVPLLGVPSQAQTPRINKEERDFQVFADRVQAYVKMQKNLEASLSTLKPTKDVAQIVEHQHDLAMKIADARRDAYLGDIFTHEVAERFRKIIRNEFHGPEGRSARQTIRQDDPSKVIVRLQVNDVFPEGLPLTTTPPALLLKLPELPEELAYRFVGHDLTLIDTKARLIVDLIPNAIP